MNSTRKFITVLVVLALVTLALALFGPLLFRKHLTENRSTVVHSAPEIAHIAKGVVESEHEAVLGSQVSGLVSEVRVVEGDSVKRGELLATIGSAKISAQIDRAQAMLAFRQQRLKELETGSRREDISISGSVTRQRNSVYEEARQEFERQQRLYAKDATTKVELDRAEEKMKTSLAQLEEARQNEFKEKNGSRSEEIAQARSEVAGAAAELSFNRAQGAEYQIRAPHEGLIVDKYKEPGESVDVGTPVLKMVDPATPRIRAELEETDIGSVRKGQAVEVTTDSYPGKVYLGKVYMVLPAVKKKSLKTFDPLASFDMNSQEIYIHLDDYARLKMGMTVTVKFKNELKK